MMKVCTKCGYTTERESKFCLQCGGPMEDFDVAAENIEAVRIAKMLMEEAQANQVNIQNDVEPQQERAEEKEQVKVTDTNTNYAPERPMSENPASVQYKAEENINTPNSSAGKKNNTILYVIIAVLIVAVLGMGAFIFFGGASDADKDNETEIENVIDDEDNDNDTEDAIAEEEGESSELEEESAEEEIEYGAPEFNSVYASSELAGDGSNTYVAANLVDSDYSTAWVEGVEGYGEGEYIAFSGNGPQQVSKITIVNGYWKSEEIYGKNSAVKTLEISFSGGEKKQVALNYGYGKVTEIVLDEPIVCETITMKVKSIYPGSECEDTCISEIFFE